MPGCPHTNVTTVYHRNSAGVATSYSVYCANYRCRHHIGTYPM